MITAAHRRRPATLMEMFRERAEARAYLFGHYVFHLQEAVDRLQRDASVHGLVDLVGVDAVQAILSAAFAPWREPS